MNGWHGLWLVVLPVLLGPGCTQQPSPNDAAARPAASRGSAASPSAKTVRPPADSGLAIKRGTASIRDGHASFRPCGVRIDLQMIDRSDGAWGRRFADDTRDGELSLYIEAYGERSAADGDDPAVDSDGGIFVLEQVLYAVPQGQARGCEAPMPDYRLLARGNEPFWALEVHDAVLAWKQPDLPDGVELGEFDMENLEGAVRYRAADDSHALELLVDMRPCQDSMSGELFAFTARAVLDGRRFNGCARLVR